MKPITLARVQLGLHRRRSQYWFVSFPKSGRTWTKSIVEAYLVRKYGVPSFTFEEFTPPIRLGRVRNIPRMCFIHPHCRDTRGRDTEEFMHRLRNKKVVFLVRDPRKVVFTYYFRLRKRICDATALDLTLSEFIRHPELGIERIVDFTNIWFGAADRFGSYLCLRFEDIQARPDQEIGHLLEFLKIPVDAGLLDKVISETQDVTTCAIEDDSATLRPSDEIFIAEAMEKLVIGLGY